jgi:serine phosphatase RsbU (regulator of sigma subunit)
MSSPSSLTVLVISDCDQTRAALAWMLNAAFQDPVVIDASGAATAADSLTAQRIDCVLLDAGADCADRVLQSIATQTQQDHVPLLLLASGNDSRQRELGESHGVTQWLYRESLAPQLLEQSMRAANEVASLQLMLDEQGRELERLHKAEQEAAEAREAATEIEQAASDEATSSPATNEAVASAAPLETSGAPSHAINTESAPGPFTQQISHQSVEDEELASRVQKDLMPPGSPLLEGYEVAGISISADSTGGDYYDYLPMSEDLLTVSIGECSGRGLAPVILMSSLRAYLRVLSRRSQDVSEVVSEANTLITDDIGDEEFLVTLLLVQIDSMTKALRYCSAGLQAHIIDSSGQTTVLPSTGMPLGLRRETVIPPGETQRLRPGDLLLLTTDGAQKVVSPTGEQFGLERLLDIVRQNRDLPARMIVTFLKKACQEFAGDAGPSDDITIVIVKAS